MRINSLFGLLILLYTASCTNQKTNPSIQKNEADHLVSDYSFSQKNIDSIPPCYWHQLEDIQTPNGISINYRLIKDSLYHIAWGKENHLRTFPDVFYCDSPAITKPYFVEETKDYLVLRFGCGTTCWGGLFLPLDPDIAARKIHYYYDYDLENDLVAYLDSEAGKPAISIKNLKSSEKILHPLGEKCKSAIPTYCLDSLSIQGGELYYKWTSDIKINVNETREKRIKLLKH